MGEAVKTSWQILHDGRLQFDGHDPKLAYQVYKGLVHEFGKDFIHINRNTPWNGNETICEDRLRDDAAT